MSVSSTRFTSAPPASIASPMSSIWCSADSASFAFRAIVILPIRFLQMVIAIISYCKNEIKKMRRQPFSGIA